MSKKLINIARVDWSAFSMLIEARRHHLGLSQLDLAAHINVSIDDLKNVENGMSVSALSYDALCTWYGVKHEWFYKDVLCEKKQALSWM